MDVESVSWPMCIDYISSGWELLKFVQCIFFYYSFAELKLEFEFSL